MSARVVLGLAPAGKPHPATKWSLLMTLLVVVVLGIPNMANAGQPTVQPPTGPESGGVFTGTYTFSTYISCSGGFSFNSSYSNSLEGTHSFAFYGAADGSLLVTIDSGGMQLITSCGDPFTGPHTNVANYTVTKDSTPPPTPTPTPSPTPTPTPPPASGGGGSSGGGTSGPAKTKTPSPSAAPHPSSSAAPATASPSAEPSPTASATPVPAAGGPLSPSPSPGATPPVKAASAASIPLAWRVAGLILALIVALGSLVWAILRSPYRREQVRLGLASLHLRFEPYIFRVRYALDQRLRARGRTTPKAAGLSPHHQSGKLLAHHHTSYPALAFLILVSGLVAAGYSLSTRADSSSSLLSVTVMGPPPSTAATIDDPTDGDHFSTSSITVRGTCPSGLFVEMYRNGSFAGSSLCDVNNLYSVLITLVPGQNDLVARDLDALSQYGPDSATVSVFYDPPPPPSPTPTPSLGPSAPSGGGGTPTPSPGAPARRQTPKSAPTPTPAPLITTDSHFYQGGEVGLPIAVNASVEGGQPPYAITWEWGDGSRDITHPDKAGAISLQHTYTKPGAYQVTLRASDALRREGILQLVVIINGPVTTAGIGRSAPEPGNLVVVWPLLSITALIVLSFWLGERHKFSLLRSRSAA